MNVQQKWQGDNAKWKVVQQQVKQQQIQHNASDFPDFSLILSFSFCCFVVVFFVFVVFDFLLWLHTCCHILATATPASLYAACVFVHTSATPTSNGTSLTSNAASSICQKFGAHASPAAACNVLHAWLCCMQQIFFNKFFTLLPQIPLPQLPINMRLMPKVVKLVCCVGLRAALRTMLRFFYRFSQFLLCFSKAEVRLF